MPVLSWLTSVQLLSWLMLADIVPYSTLLPGDINRRWYLHLPVLAAICLPTLSSLWRTKLLPAGYWWFLAWVAVTITYTPEPVTVIGRFATWILILGTVCKIASQVQNEEDLHGLLDTFLKTCAVLVWINLLAAPFNIGWNIDENNGLNRFEGFAGQPNIIGGLMACMVQAGIVHWGRCRWRKWLAATMLASVVMAAMADSRTPFVCTGVGLATWLAWQYRFKGTLVAASILIGLALLKSLNNPYINRGMDTYNGRSMYWAFEEHKIAQRPLFGYGYGIEGLLFVQSPDFRDAWFVEYNQHSSLQNGYLSLAVGIGAIGAGVFLYLFLRPWVSLFAMPKGNTLLKSVFFLVIVPMLVYAMSESGIETPKGLDGLLVYISWLLAERYRWKRLRRAKMTAMPMIDHRVVLPNG